MWFKYVFTGLVIIICGYFIIKNVLEIIAKIKDKKNNKKENEE